MPTTKAKTKPAPAKPVQTQPPPQPVEAAPQPKTPDLPVIYDKLEIEEYSTNSPKGPLTVARQKKLLGWITEKEYQKREVERHPGSEEKHWLFGDDYHCKNLAGEKVRCEYNAQNRPFDESWCEALVHTILYGQWAGPFTLHGETINCETVRVSKYGRVMSGQHQMTACIMASEQLAKDRANGTDHAKNPKYPTWRQESEPFIETIVCLGMSEDPRVLMTVDYNKPRTAADVFYTSALFRECTSAERKELCKILASAADMLWTRTDTRGYRTHPEVVAFLERHRKLLKCVAHIYSENSAKTNRPLTNLRLSSGNCAALQYLMASSGSTDPEYGDIYRNEEPPTEKNLDWSMWDKAEEFWSLLASGKDFKPVREALGRLVDSSPTNENNTGMGGRGPEKLAILAKAWELWKDHKGSGSPFSLEDLEPGGELCLSYSDLDDKGNKLPNGQIKLVDVADFYGIDSPESAGKGKTAREQPDPPAPSRDEIEKAKEEALARRGKK